MPGLCCAVAALVWAAAAAPSEAELQGIYESRAGMCDYFVAAEGGSDANTGTELSEPFATLAHAVDGEAGNRELQTDEVVCLLAGTHEVTDTIYIKGAHMRERNLKVTALGPERSATLDANGQVAIFNALQTNTHFVGLRFVNGLGSSGGAVYGERSLRFEDCDFEDNEASVHGGAVMGGRKTFFKRCEFRNNQARFAGAVRINDIGTAELEDCFFIGNSASGRGGALITQIEKPENTVTVTNTLFCFNESPMSPHIYNYRTNTHACTKCRFNNRECCSDHGRVVSIEKADSYVIPPGATRTRVCACDSGWSGERCETQTAKTEL